MLNSLKRKQLIGTFFVICYFLITTGCKDKTHTSNKVMEETRPAEKTVSQPEKTSTADTELIKATGSINLEKACGALPTLDKENCSGSKPAALSFTLINNVSKKKYVIKSDSNGVVSMKLPAGKYLVEHSGPFSVTPGSIELSAKQTKFELTFRAMLR